MLFLSGDAESTTDSSIWPIAAVQEILGTNTTNTSTNREADHERINKLQEELIEIQVSNFLLEKFVYFFFKFSINIKKKLKDSKKKTKN